ncbi:C40 family peptidase [Actinacidiphila rubida]|uniref:Cell wall-associated hydrolase, NlpC family n=1 Tax=Actinacidiphila rubida TaxID=310780 RepID=A0A1H8ML05_9ACTN|nr:C40 family peptidase [Actinacidiphila rubida]SEO18065.1 Cell wall-associated hydrolase, NlpC family [Actinacidiphila rubida]
MATHRKAKPAILSTTGPRAAVGITTAALATVTLLSETANAAPPPPPSIADIKTQVDKLMHLAEVATEQYDGAKEQVDQQNAKVDKLLAQVARRTQTLNDARRQLGQYAAAQYRGGGDESTTRYMLSGSPQDLVDQLHLTDVLAQRQKAAVESFRVQQVAATQQRVEAAKSLTTLTEQQAKLKAAKQDVQTKLAAAQHLLNSLTAKEKERLALLQLEQEREAQLAAAKIKAREAAQQLAAAKAAAAKAKSSGSSGSSTAPTTTTPSNSSVAQQAIAFARQQIGKPYVWGATGPDSFDCSGLTQAAYKAAGINLPRTTYDQVNVGTRVSEANLQPGDLIFFFSDVSHVGMYIGGGEMIHAPHTGTVVKIAPITEMPFYAAVRPY